jgi:hypothetical protein
VRQTHAGRPALRAGILLLLAAVAGVRCTSDRGADPGGTPPASVVPTPTPPPGRSLLDAVPGDGGLVAARWGTTQVLTKSVTVTTEPSPGFVALHVPEDGATFATALGVNPARWPGLASGPFRFRVAVLTARGEEGRGERRLLLEEEIDPAHEAADRRWFPVQVDLDPFRGRDVLLVLTVTAARLADAPGDLAGWAEPRLVLRSPGAAPPT